MASANLDQLTPEPNAGGERPIGLFVILALLFGAAWSGALLYSPAASHTSPKHRSTGVAVISGRPVQRQLADSAITSESLTKPGSSKPEATVPTIQNLPANEYGGQPLALIQAAPESKAPETTDIPSPLSATVAPAGIAVADPGTITADPAQLAPQSEASPVLSPSTTDGPDGTPAADDKTDPGAVTEDSPPPAKLAPDLEENMMKRASILMDQNDIAGARLVLNYLANHGSASAAFALAETYDAKTWAGHHVTGMTPDAELADEWYTRAAALGSDEAAVILLSKDKP